VVASHHVTPDIDCLRLDLASGRVISDA
jgi:hypothetical protein